MHGYDVLEKTLESPLDCKEIQLVHSKGDQSWVLLEGVMLKLKLQYFGHLNSKIECRIIIKSNNPTLGHIPELIESRESNRCVYIQVRSQKSPTKRVNQ